MRFVRFAIRVYGVRVARREPNYRAASVPAPRKRHRFEYERYSNGICYDL